MKKHVILILEYDMGDHSDIEEDGSQIPTDIDWWKEDFYQSDVLICDMDIKGVRIEEREEDLND